MRFFQSLWSRTAAIVVSGLILSNLVGYVLYSRDKQDALFLQDALDMSERAAGVSRLLRDIPDEWTDHIVTVSDSRAFRVWMSGKAPFGNDLLSDEEISLEDYTRKHIPRIQEREIRVWFRPELPDAVDLPIEAAGEEVTHESEERWFFLLSISHGDEEWLNFYGRVVPVSSHLGWFLALNILIFVICLGVIVLWLLNRVTAPLQDLARAASRLGRDLTAEPIKETGPLEVRAAARAFNSMQRKLLKQIEARTGMLASISHDLRTPITQMRLRTELLPASENRSKTLDTLDDMNAIIGTFLDFARVSADSEARTVVEFSSLVESICHDFADRGEDVSFTGPSDVRYPCKRVAMKRALSNLIQNAVAYGIRARVTLSQEIDELILTVNDDGPGIREEEMAVVFQPFRRLQSSSPNHKDGVGLGLSIAQSIVEDHGGSISLRNRHHGGLSVTVRLPVPE